MPAPKVSVIIPAYNLAHLLPEAVSSALGQSYGNLEVVVVNDASTDDTDRVMRRFDDPRVRYVAHETNRYIGAARNTGIRASTGDLIAFLDADDRFHRDKLRAHVALLAEHPGVGLSYNGRVEIDRTGNPLAVVVPPPRVGLAELVTAFPFAPSDVVVRREWASRVGLFDERHIFHAEDRDFHVRLALEGCQMMSADQVLNDRRLHAGRTVSHLPEVLGDVFRALDRAFTDPRCPPGVLALRGASLATMCVAWAFVAFAQDEVAVGSELLGDALAHDPRGFAGCRDDVRRSLVHFSIRDGGEHEATLRRVWPRVRAVLDWIGDEVNPVVGLGFALRSLRAALWGRAGEAEELGGRAIAFGAAIDEAALGELSAHLLAYERLAGREAADAALRRLAPLVKRLGRRRAASRFLGLHAINRAFTGYRAGRFRSVPGDVLRGFAHNPAHWTNRGAVKILLRSIGRTVAGRTAIGGR